MNPDVPTHTVSVSSTPNSTVTTITTVGPTPISNSVQGSKTSLWDKLIKGESAMLKDLKLFEKFLKGYKTYLVTFGAIVYGVLVTGFSQHHWTSIGGAWTWVFSASGVAAFRAAFAVHSQQVISALLGLGNQSTVVTPTVAQPEVNPIAPPAQTPLGASSTPTVANPVSQP